MGIPVFVLNHIPTSSPDLHARTPCFRAACLSICDARAFSKRCPTGIFNSYLVWLANPGSAGLSYRSSPASVCPTAKSVWPIVHGCCAHSPPPRPAPRMSSVFRAYISQCRVPSLHTWVLSENFCLFLHSGGFLFCPRLFACRVCAATVPVWRPRRFDWAPLPCPHFPPPPAAPGHRGCCRPRGPSTRQSPCRAPPFCFFRFSPRPP